MAKAKAARVDSNLLTLVALGFDFHMVLLGFISYGRK